MTPAVQSFFHAPTNTWSHLVSDPATRAAAIIDPVRDFDPAAGRVSNESAAALLAAAAAAAARLDIGWILETHAHADHLSAADWIKHTLGARQAPPRIGIGAGIVALQRHFR